MVDELWKDFGGNGHGLIKVLSLRSPRETENNGKKPQDRQGPSQDSNWGAPQFKPTVLLLDQPVRFFATVKDHSDF
jgi:hypothetical protein